MSNWPPPASVISDMPVDLLAMELLRELEWREERAYPRERIVGPNGITTSKGVEYHQRSVLVAVNEAWDWLFIHGYTVQDPDQPHGYRRLTRKGINAAPSANALRNHKAEQLLAVDLHSALASKARTMFLMGSYDSAVFESFKQLEVRVRQLAGLDNSRFGKGLMHAAFAEKTGVLTDQSLDPGEQVGTMQLFAGAIAAIKNPPSHRNIDYEDPTVAAEAIIFADFLHRLLDRYADRLQSKHAGSSATIEL